MTIEKGHIIAGCSLSDIAVVTTRFKTPEGYLDVQANISRSGIQEYQAGELGITDRDQAQLIRVLRPESEVFDEKSMVTFAKQPVTDEHPPALVTSENNRYYNVGSAGERVVKDGDTVATTLRITDKKAVDKIEAGTVELSCGYLSDIVMESGTDPKFGTYDAIQKNIRGNHIAIVKKGRAGNVCKIKDKALNDKKGANTMLMMFNDVEIEVTAASKQAIEKQAAQLVDANASLNDADVAHKAEIEKLTVDHKAAIDKLTGELDATKEQVLTDEQLDTKVAERASIVDAASKIIKDFKADGKSNKDIKVEVVQAKHADMKLDDKSDDYINAFFDATLTKFSKGSDNLDNVHFDKKPETGDPIADARNKCIKDGQNAYKSNQAS